MANDTKSWPNELEAIHKRPGMFFGRTDKPFTSLLGFLTGYQCGYAAAQHGHMSLEEFVPSGFAKSVVEYFGHTFPTGKGSVHIADLAAEK